MPTYHCPQCGKQHENPANSPDQFMLCCSCSANPISQHYPLPYTHQHGPIVDADGDVICIVKAKDTSLSRKPMNDTGEFIVRACNSYEELLAACSEMLPWIERFAPFSRGHVGVQDAINHARTAIAKAKRRPS